MLPDDTEPVVLDPSDPAFAVLTDVGESHQGTVMKTGAVRTTAVVDRSVLTAQANEPGGHRSDVPATAHRRHLLGDLAARAVAGLPRRPDALALLARIGITDEATVSAFGVGAGDAAFLGGLTDDDRSAMTTGGLLYRCRSPLAGPGFVIPTRDPRDFQTVLGFVKVTPGQLKHTFLGPPAGVACAAESAESPRIILCDQPLLALRLHQAGACGVVLVEDPAVLPPLLPWLAQRSLLLVSQKARSLERLAAALGDGAEKAERLLLPSEMGRIPVTSYAVLGIERQPQEGPPITPQLLHDLYAYARGRFDAGEATRALSFFSLTDPVVIAAYGIGYLPPTYREALSATQRAAFAGLRLADTLVIPAYDVQGAIVDLLAIHSHERANSYTTVADSPRGLLAPIVATAHRTIVVTDTLHLVGRLSARGQRAVLLIRGPADAADNATRLAAAGVREAMVRVRRHSEAIAAPLRAAGIAVQVASASARYDDTLMAVGEANPGAIAVRAAAVARPEPDIAKSAAAPVVPPASVAPPSVLPMEITSEPTAGVPGPPLVLAAHDHQADRATFTAGAITYVIEVPPDEDTTRLDVVVRHAGTVHREVADLAVEAACARVAGNAALRCAVPAALIRAQLPLLLAGVRDLRYSQDHQPETATVPAGPERDAALARLRAPDLLDRMADDLTAQGWVGEAEAKRVLLLAAISRKLPEPLWVMRSAASDLTGALDLDLIAAITPPEDLVHVSRLSPAALSYQEPDALRHKLLVIDETSSLSEEVIMALRVLRTRGALSQAVVPRHILSGSARTRTIEVHGPLAVLAASSGTVHAWFSALCCTVPVDGSPEQTERILAAERQRHALVADGVHAARRARLQHAHALQRLIVSRPVVIPFAERIHFPAMTMNQRSDQSRFLGLVSASALLHQHQRLSDRGHVVAHERDFHIAASLARAAGIGAVPGMTPGAVDLLGVLASLPGGSATMEALRRHRPGWTRHACRVALQELMEAELVTSPAGGRGRERAYTLEPVAREVVAHAQWRDSGILLRPPGAVAEVGEGWRGDDANFIPSRISG